MKKSNRYFKEIISSNMNYIIMANNKYTKKGFEISLCGDKDEFEVIFNNSKYYISVKKIKKRLYWHLEPYKDTFFETLINNNFNTFEMVLCAVYDNEEVHKKGIYQCK